LICNDADITKGSLVSGHKLEFACSGRIDCSEFVSEGMTSVNSIVEWRIFDKYGEDVSKNYDVTTVDGLLTLVMDAN
jgi:hypothetical protein